MSKPAINHRVCTAEGTVITFWFNQSAVIRLQCVDEEAVFEYISHGDVPKDLRNQRPGHPWPHSMSIATMVQLRPNALNILEAGLDHALALACLSAHARLTHMRQLRDISRPEVSARIADEHIRFCSGAVISVE
jgi:hypothetical protein